MTALTKYDVACAALAAAKNTDEVLHLRDTAEGMRAYAHQAKNRTLELDAAEIRLRAERRLGEMIQAQKATVGLNVGKRGDRGPRAAPRSDARPTLNDVGISKKLSSTAQKLAALPVDDFEAMIARWRDQIIRANTRVTVNLLRAAEIERRDAKLAAQTLTWPEGRWPVLLGDPPWRSNQPTSEWAAEQHYPTLLTAEICALPVSGIAADDAVLYLWTTIATMEQAIQVINAWGFEYRSNIVWDKGSIGLGALVRNRHEHLLIGLRGNLSPPAPADRPASVVFAPRAKHSAKPNEFYEIIEKAYPTMPKIELFARTPRAGWAAWGNEIPTEKAA
ncbi:MAG: MT-A70 family methyltransferase [Alphaproteobacteria bacterium]|nr:MT-A70 family methyltransferase [Alphaproteobacteria bacterium]